MFDTVLVADRGEVARRVVRTCQRMGVKAVTVHTDVEPGALHVLEADESVLLGDAASYRDGAKVLEAAQRTRAQAVHPGYGFLAEDADFAQAVLDAGLTWIGPPVPAVRAAADKAALRELVAAVGVPVLEATTDLDAVRAYPVMVKPRSGGGGRGMTVAHDEAQARRSARGPVLLERYLPDARHVEVQLLGSTVLGDRECSVQRRHQKLVEEAPARLTDEQRCRLHDAARRTAQALSYENLGTVEFLVADDAVFLLEVNPRLQVEHPVTESVTGLDLVEQQLLTAAGEASAGPVASNGHALQLRVCAEDPIRFLPGPGRITRWQEPADVRVDSGYREGDVVTTHYDPLLAKIVAWAPTRDGALARARQAVQAFVVEGPKVNLPFLAELLEQPEFVSGTYDTGIVRRMRGST